MFTLRYPLFLLMGLLTLLWAKLSPTQAMPVAEQSPTPAAWVQIQNELAPETIALWNEQAKLTASDPLADDYFGWSVAVSGDTAVIGSLFDDDGGSNSGSAYVFTRTAGVWSQQAKLTASDADINDRFGYAVAVDGDTALIGAYFDDDGGSDSGSAYVFTHTAGVWSQQAKLTAHDPAAGDKFGWSVAVHGDTAVIGAWGDDDGGSDSGSAYVFTRTAGVWSQQAKLTAYDPFTDDRFGYSVAVYGDTAVIGARMDDDVKSDSGSAYVFTRTAGVWSQQAKLTAHDPAIADRFGHSVALSGDTAAIGAYRDDEGGLDTGSVYLFTHTAGVWSQQAKLTANDPGADDLFGWAVALSGDTAVIGAVQDDDGGSDSGAAYLFTRTAGVWSQQAKLTTSDTSEDDQFGIAVAISGDTAVIGAWHDDDGGSNSGSAYAFVLTYPLTITLSGTGSGNVVSQPSGIDCGLDCEDAFFSNIVITLTATADPGFMFEHWTEDGNVVSTEANYSFTATAGRSLVAHFVAIPPSSFHLYLPLIRR